MSFGLFWLPILLHTQNIKALFSWIYIGLTHENFITTKTEKHRLPFLATKYSIKFISDMFYDRRPLYCKCINFLFLICYLFIKSKVEKRKILFLVTKRGQKAYPIYFFDPQFPNFGWFHLLFLIHFHFVTTKLKKRKIPFLVTKRNKKI